MKKSAWTLMELWISFIMLAILAGFLISTFKPNTQKIKLFLYASVSNMDLALSDVTKKNSKYDTADASWICKHVADVFTLKGNADCTTTSNSAINYTFPNGVTIQGMTNAWVAGDSYYYKDIVIDIDGKKGFNKVGLDRYPLRIYSGTNVTGLIIPVDCTGTITPKSTYCKDGFTMTGSEKKVNFLTSEDLVLYDVLRRKEKSSTNAVTKVSAQSYLKALCAAGGGSKLFDKTVCNTNGFKIYSQCITKKQCTTCNEDGINICPSDTGSQVTKSNCETFAAKNNPENLSCFVDLNKPSVGMNMVLAPIVNAIY